MPPPPGPPRDPDLPDDSDLAQARREWLELVARVRAGDAAGLEAIFRAFAAPLAAFAYRYVRSRDTAAELVQDVFYRIWRSREAWHIEGSLQAYLYRATRNRVLDYLKHERIERRWAERSAAQRTDLEAPSLPSADAAVETADLVARLEQVLDELPERRRQVFLLRWKEGKSYDEIARLLGVTTKTVENQMTQALRTLRRRLGPPERR